MKKNYILVLVFLIATLTYSQGYELGIVHISGHNFKIVAIPDFTTTEVTNNLDAGFTLMLPAGSDDAVSPVGLLGGRPWDIVQYDAATLVSAGGDGTQDAFQFNLPASTTIFSHTAGQQIDLVSFDITNAPIAGEMEFLLNSDPLATTAGIFDSFYQTDLDGAGGSPTQDYFSGLASGMDSFAFSVLSISEVETIGNEISVYPNPASNYIVINSTIEIKKLELFDLLGKQVVSTNETEQIKVDHLPVGMYLLKVFTENGTLTRKIIIE